MESIMQTSGSIIWQYASPSLSTHNAPCLSLAGFPGRGGEGLSAEREARDRGAGSDPDPVLPAPALRAEQRPAEGAGGEGGPLVRQPPPYRPPTAPIPAQRPCSTFQYLPIMFQSCLQPSSNLPIIIQWCLPAPLPSTTFAIAFK